MNPSAPGWITKFGSEVQDRPNHYKDVTDLYQGLKKTGFVYGINTDIPKFIETAHSLSEDEKAKLNLLTALYYTYRLEKGENDFTIFLEVIFAFYQELRVNQISFLASLFVEKKTSTQLEKLIESRVYLDDNVISKTFNSIITNSLLFIDVLLFKRYLKHSEGIYQYAQTLEYLAINVTYHALHSKEKNKNDKKLAQLFEASLTFIDGSAQHFDGSYRERLLKNKTPLENQYFLDIACLSVWEDHSLEYQESDFIFGIGNDLGFQNKQIALALEEVTYFFHKNADTIPFLKDQNLALQFYDSMSKIVNKLILRNSKRLQKELSESKELVSLISKSTIKELTPDERKKMQHQLLDIFKSIPSLAIFILPGGAVLLPIFIKLIPKLLPSSFDDNRIEK
ncbi:LETM1-related biofilm-associated protein [Maribacter sp. 2-571]|uniref:LETM1-related biofilm-associated protein n=1 Tax=Maribacter sp. 2-571 TaxID=3417569 RepID=UPI003D3464D1